MDKRIINNESTVQLRRSKRERAQMETLVNADNEAKEEVSCHSCHECIYNLRHSIQFQSRLKRKIPPMKSRQQSSSNTVATINEIEKQIHVQTAENATMTRNISYVNESSKSRYPFLKSPRLVLHRIKNIHEYDMDVLRRSISHQDNPKEQEEVIRGLNV